MRRPRSLWQTQKARVSRIMHAMWGLEELRKVYTKVFSGSGLAFESSFELYLGLLLAMPGSSYTQHSL